MVMICLSGEKKNTEVTEIGEDEEWK